MQEIAIYDMANCMTYDARRDPTQLYVTFWEPNKQTRFLFVGNRMYEKDKHIW